MYYCKFLEYSHFACVIVHLENHFQGWISWSKKFLECPPSCDGVSNTVWHSYHYVCHLMFYLSLHPSVFTSTQQLCFRKLTTTLQFQLHLLIFHHSTAFTTTFRHNSITLLIFILSCGLGDSLPFLYISLTFILGVRICMPIMQKYFKLKGWWLQIQ